MSFNESEFSNYFPTPQVANIQDNKFVPDKNECFLLTLKRIFGIELSCMHYDTVVNGQGNENEKIATKYSSSLQSFLIFSQVSKDNQISINGISYDEVHFEYKNKAFGYPSCIDVVLLNRKARKILFIESKLAEIIRDSSDKGSYEIGPSYFSDKGYPNIIKRKEDLAKIGINIRDIKLYGEADSSKIKESIINNAVDCNRENAYIPVNKLSGQSYVYSYGIKQILSHSLGIYYFKTLEKKKIPENCDNYLFECKGYDYRFIELYNALPNIKDSSNDCKKKIDNFLKHVKKTFEILIDSDRYSTLSYQELYKQNSNTYFVSCEKFVSVISYYHLNE